MTDAAKRARKQRHDVTRRDFVLARLGRLGAAKPADQEPTAKPDAGQRKPLVLRYPKSLHDVSAGDSPGGPDSSFAPTSLPAIAARRRTIPVLRPPGAIDEPSFLADCTRCELCIQACPHDAIVHAPPQLREAAGTPLIDPDRQPCRMCAEFPCISACEPDALSALVPPLMGTARIIEHLCLPHHGTSCTVCSEHCPVENAIVIRDGKPTVNESTCTGCGVCRWVCPAPENAILLMPMFLRPAPKEQNAPEGKKRAQD